MKKLVWKLLAFFLISCTVAITGCFSSPGDKYIGTWSYITPGENEPEQYLVIEKLKNSESYMLTEYRLTSPQILFSSKHKKKTTKNIYNLLPEKDRLVRDAEHYFYFDNEGKVRGNTDYGKEGFTRISEKPLTFAEIDKGRGYPDPDKKK